MTRRVYFDYQATTPVDKRVVETMLPYFSDVYGNAASRSHAFGWEAEEAVDQARKQIAKALNSRDQEVIFTSGATESNNLAIMGIAEMYKEKGNHIVTMTTEHPAVLDPCEALSKKGYDITYLNPGTDGILKLEDLAAVITEKTILVTMMYANNEIGVIQPVAEIGALCRKHGIFFHTDATQAVGKIPVDVQEDQIDLLSFSGHKLYGPKGVGALYVRRRNPRVRLAPIMHGGGHERGMRSGTLNVAGIVGLGKAVELSVAEMAAEAQRAKKLRQRLEDGILSQLDFTQVNGHPLQRLPGCTNISFNYVEGEGLMMAFPELAVSSGSACTSASLEPSHVLRALGLKDELAHSSIRFGIGRMTTEEDIDFAIEKVVAAVKRLRELSPLYEMVMEGIDLDTVEWTDHH